MMFKLLQTPTFNKWRRKLKDRRALVMIASRLDRLVLGHTGDARAAGPGISEMRIDHGPGYRIYFQVRGTAIVLLLCGGDKDTQEKDIRTAKKLAAEWSESND